MLRTTTLLETFVRQERLSLRSFYASSREFDRGISERWREASTLDASQCCQTASERSRIKRFINQDANSLIFDGNPCALINGQFGKTRASELGLGLKAILPIVKRA